MTVEYNGVLDALERLRRQAQAPREALDEVGISLVEDARLGFREESDPWGNPWEPLAEATQEGRRGTPPYQLLRDSGALFNSLGHEVRAPDEVAVGVGTGQAAKYAAIHQFGGQAGRNHATHIPARPYLPIRDGGVDLPPDTEDNVLSIITRHLEDAWTS